MRYVKLKLRLVERVCTEDAHNYRFLNHMLKNCINSIMNSCDVQCMIPDIVPAFYYGTSPNKFFDYISCGMPVLNNYPGWLADLIREHPCGEAVPPENPRAFADALCRLADEPDLRQEYRQNARQLAETVFSRERLASQFTDWLEKV